jgi:arylsulfatase A-like enzyme
VETPNIDRLVERGAVSWQAQTIFPPVTVPAHASMLTGLDVDEHGILHNSYSTETLEPPTFVTTAYDAGYRAAMIVGKNKLEQFHQREGMPFIFALVGDRTVVDAVIEHLNDGYEVIFAHFPNPDFFGHLIGWMSDTYLYELTNTDAQIGRILDELEALEIDDSTLIIITADHGGHDRVHWRNQPEDMLIPWLIAGPGVIAGQELGDDIRVTDTAFTVLCALGLPLPQTDSGRPVIEAFSHDLACAPDLAATSGD